MRREGLRVSNYLMHMLRRSDGLLARAALALQRTVAARPNDAAALHRLGDVQRGLGQLGEALECYRRVLALHPDDPRAQRLAAILSGRAPPGEPGAAPMPFAYMVDFLPEQRCKALLALALANRGEFKPAPYARRMQRTHAEVESSHGKFVVDPRITEEEVRPWFEPHLRGAFAQVLPRLQMREPSDWRLEIGLSAYRGGGRFFSKHSDGGPLGDRVRTLCFCYYFHRQPRGFSGGDLLLYDGDGTHGTQSFTRIEPQHNSIVFFPAACIHQVAPFERDVADFGDARFAVHGWLNESAKDVRAATVLGSGHAA